MILVDILSNIKIKFINLIKITGSQLDLCDLIMIPAHIIRSEIDPAFYLIKYASTISLINFGP